jgi:hypothetical protein
MDGQRFDKLAKAFAEGTDRRGFLKRIAGLAAGAAAVAVPARASATIEAYCSSDYDCDSYNHEVCSSYGTCVCDYGYKDCNGACIPEYDCCSDYDCGKNEVCSYGTCECPTYDGYKICEYDGSCVPEYGCCSDYDCSYGETCEYGSCQAEDSQAPETPVETTTPPPSKEQNYSKKLARQCNAKCLRSSRQSARKKGVRFTSAKLKRARNSCRRRCAQNSR